MSIQPSQISSAQANLLVERLVKTVGRAFYTDTIVVVLDALLREKYIKESELAPRLRLKEKDIRAVLTRLENSDLMIKHESLLARDQDGKNRQHKFYYIDFQFFVDVVRYRLFLMQRRVDAQQSSDIQEVKFECPTCKLQISMLDATRSRSADQKFICTRCCPHDNFRERDAEKYYTLISLETHLASLKNATTLKNKLLDAMSVSPYHESIYALLKELNHVKVSRNLPSDNMRLGFHNTTVTDEVTQMAISESLGKAVAQKKGRFLVENEIEKSRHDEATVNVEIEEASAAAGTQKRVVRADEEDEEEEATDKHGRKRIRRANYVPEFLQRSGVQGSEEVYRMQSLNASASFVAGADGAAASATLAASKHSSNANSTGLAVTSLKAATTTAAAAPPAADAAAAVTAEDGDGFNGEDEEEDEDINWED